MLNDYFCTVAEKLIGPADKIQPLHAHSSEIANTLTITSIKISQKEIEEMICKLKVKKATGPDGVPARLLKSAGTSYCPISHERGLGIALKPASHQISGR